MVICDAYGYMSFCDRLGDTYRWRGENVATTAIENVITSFLKSTDVVVYGVEIPGEEGKCGMAAIAKIDESCFDLDNFSEYLKNNLTPYSRPVFIRFVDSIEYTGNLTFSVLEWSLLFE